MMNRFLLLLALLILISTAGCSNSGADSSAESSVSGLPLKSSFDVSPDGKSIVLTAAGDGGQDLYILDLSTKKLRCIAQTSAYEMEPRYSRDGKFIIYAAADKLPEGPIYIYTYSTITGVKRLITSGSHAQDDFPVFLGKSDRNIAFARAATVRPYSMGGMISTNWDIYTLDTNSGKLTRLTKDRYYQAISLDSSPDGHQIVASAIGADSNTNVLTVNMTLPSHRTIITHSADKNPKDIQSAHAAYFHHQSSICYIHYTDAESATRGEYYDGHLSKMSPDGHGQQTIAHPEAIVDCPRVTSDDQFMYYLADPSYDVTDTPYSLWRLDLRTKAVEQIAPHDMFSDPEKYEASSGESVIPKL